MAAKDMHIDPTSKRILPQGGSGTAPPLSRIPPSYRLATWRTTLPLDDATNCRGLAFNVLVGDTTEVIRLKLDAESVKHLVESLAERRYYHRIEIDGQALEVGFQTLTELQNYMAEHGDTSLSSSSDEPQVREGK